MPSWVKDEDKWEKAKKIVKKEYNLSEKDEEKFWRLVTGIYKRMGGEIKASEDFTVGTLIPVKGCKYGIYRNGKVVYFEEEVEMVKNRDRAISGIIESLSRGDNRRVAESGLESVTDLTENFYNDVAKILKSKGYTKYKRYKQSALVTREFINREGEAIALSGWDRGVYGVGYTVLTAYMRVRDGDFVDELEFTDPLNRSKNWEGNPDIRKYEKFLREVLMKIKAL